MNATHRRYGNAAEIHFEHLPSAIAGKLRESVARVRRILWMRGLLATVAMTLAAILAIMGIDAAVLIYSSAVRWMLSLAGLAVVLVTAARTLARPLLRPLTPARIAALIEQRHPELEERLSTVVELLSAPETRDRGSVQLLQVLTHAAEADARDVAPEAEFTTRTVKPKLVAAGVFFGVLALLFAAWPRHVGRLFARAVAPFAQIDNVYADNLLVAPGDHVMLQGAPLELRLVVTAGFPGQAYVRREAIDARGRRRETVERMRQIPNEEGIEGVRGYRLLFPSVDNSFRYRIACGHALTRYYTVTALLRPAAESIGVRYTYPAYTGKAPLEQSEDLAEIAVVPGTRVDLTARLNRKDLTARLALPPNELPATPDAEHTVRWTFEVASDLDTRWGVLLQDAHGFTNLPVFFPARAVPDRAPTVVLERPQETRLTLPPHARLGLTYVVTDDFGIEPPQLLVGMDDAEPAPLRALNVPANVAPEVWLGEDTLDLAGLQLAGVRRVRVQLSVADRLPPELGGPQEARSAIVTVEIDHQAMSLESQTVRDQARNLIATLQEAAERLRGAEREATALVAKLQPQGAFADESDQRRLDEIRQDAALAEKLVRELAEETEGTAFEALRERLEALAETAIEPARAQAEVAQLADAAEQPREVAELDTRLEEAVRATEQMLQGAQDLAEQVERLARLDELAMREQALADAAPAAATPEQMEAWAAMQEQLAEQLQQEMAQDPEALAEALEQQQEQAAALASEARDLARQQENLRQLTQNLAQPESRAQAAEQLRQMTPAAPAEATPEQLAAQQEAQIAGQAEDLAQRAEDLLTDMEELGAPTAPATPPMRQAAQELARAEEQAGEAADALARPPAPPGAQPPPDAVGLQQAAQQSLERAAAGLEQTQSELGEAAQALREQSSSLSEALASMEQAAEAAQQAAATPPGAPAPSPSPPGAPAPAPPGAPAPGMQPGMQPAQQAAQQAAQQLRQMVQQAATHLGMPVLGAPHLGTRLRGAATPAPPGDRASDQSAMQHMQTAARRAVPPVPLPDALRGVMTERDWFRLRGEVRAGAMDDALRGVPPEYRELVRLYFRELARQEER